MYLPAVRRLFLIALVPLLAACATPPASTEVNDPLEGVNRGTHAFNKGLDRTVIRPASQGYGNTLPGEVRMVVDNFAQNFGEPQNAVNAFLQGRPQDVMRAGVRFGINSTIGLLGLFDPATDLGVPARDTDFGETLYIWGIGEGPYVELPVLGPSTSRHAVGRVVDFVTNPLDNVIESPEQDYAAGGRAGSLLNTRYELTGVIDPIYYDSADSYSQARILYLQQRRFQLQGDEQNDDDIIDPFEEFE